MMEKKISALSQQPVKRHVKSQSLVELMSSKDSSKSKRKTDVLNNSKLFSSSFNKKSCDTIKITHQNFKEVVLSLTHRILTGNQTGKELLGAIAGFLKEENSKLDEQIQTMLIDINYIKDTFDLLSPLKVIQARIIKETLKKENPIGRIAFDIWYDYLHDKYNVDRFEDFRRCWITDINTFKEFFANIIYQVYGEWVFLIEKKKDMFPYIWKQFTPYLLTSHPKFDIVYKIILRHLGEEPLKINPNQTLASFGIRPEFSCQEMEVPFEKTIEIIKSLYRDCGLKKKIIKIKELAVTLKQQLRTYQDYRIGKKLQSEYKDIDSDNMVGCFSYCIMKSGYGGIFQALDYLEMFFLESYKEKSSDYIQGLKIGHIMATLQTAAMYLRQPVDE